MRAMKVVVVVLFGCMPVVQAKERLTWLFIDWPPFVEMQGDTLVGGRTGEQMKMLFAQLPEYDHVTQKVSLVRMESELTSSREVCSMPLRKTPRRDALMRFSIPMNIGLTTRLIVRQETARLLSPAPEVDLATVIRNPALRGVIYRSRSYGAVLDTIFASAGPDANFAVMVLDSENVLKMLDNQRIDYTIEYPSVVRYWEAKQTASRQPLVALKIAGNTDFSVGFLACSQTPWGEKTVKRINAALRTLIQLPAYQSLLYAELSEEEKVVFHRYWQEQVIDVVAKDLAKDVAPH